MEPQLTTLKSLSSKLRLLAADLAENKGNPAPMQKAVEDLLKFVQGVMLEESLAVAFEAVRAEKEAAHKKDRAEAELLDLQKAKRDSTRGKGAEEEEEEEEEEEAALASQEEEEESAAAATHMDSSKPPEDLFFF